MDEEAVEVVVGGNPHGAGERREGPAEVAHIEIAGTWAVRVEAATGENAEGADVTAAVERCRRTGERSPAPRAGARLPAAVAVHAEPLSAARVASERLAARPLSAAGFAAERVGSRTALSPARRARFPPLAAVPILGVLLRGDQHQVREGRGGQRQVAHQVLQDRPLFLPRDRDTLSIASERPGKTARTP